MRTYRAGENVEDLCRACKIDRVHTVIAADSAGRPIRVQCDFCGSQHNFRGGGAERVPATASAPARVETHDAPTLAVPRLSERERIAPPVAANLPEADLEAVLRRMIRLESGVTVAVPADKWRDGQLVLRPGRPGLQEKVWPIETFFHKIVMIRNRLRTLEQQVNAMDFPEDAKIRLQAYVTACYGSLTSFNILFAEDEDHFKGVGGDSEAAGPSLPE
ncbi:MAG TPA: hypothetical protein VGK32_15535 [Vicinamibacterales bacterium]|jgi:hypothetical protein